MSETFSAPSSSGSAEPDLSPLASTLLDAFTEGLVVLDPDGRVVYANRSARDTVAGLGLDLHAHDAELPLRLLRAGGRSRALRIGELDVGMAVFLPGPAADSPSAVTLADREKAAIVRMLEANGGKLSATAKQLGISRTTLWRRLKAYGLHGNGRGP